MVDLDYLQSNQMPDLLNNLKAVAYLSFVAHISNIMGPQSSSVTHSVNLVVRCKTVSRRVPLHIRRRIIKRRRQRLLSLSSHDPPMVASCLQCEAFIPWSESRQNWLDCSEREGSCSNIYGDWNVVCTVCSSESIYVRRLDQYVCIPCLD